MASNKLARINEDIARELSALLRDVKDPRVSQGMISIIAVNTTPDLKFAKIHLSILGLEDEKRMEKGLQAASGYLRRELGHRLSLRNTPELTFVLDKSIEHGARMSKILQELDIKDDTETDDNV